MAYEILRYDAALSQNRQQFLLAFKAEFESFDALDRLFPRFAAAAGRAEKASYRLGPFLQIMQRETRNAFESLAAGQSCVAWCLLRPVIEAPLIMGKWLDDPQNAVLWLSRNSGKTARKEYQDAYSGDRQKPHSLPHGEAIRGLLSRLGDDFLQTNPRYYARPPSFAPDAPRSAGAAPDYADDPADHRAHVYALLHALWFIMRSTGQMLAAGYGDRPELHVDLVAMERSFAAAAISIARGNEVHKNVLVNLGLWPHELVH